MAGTRHGQSQGNRYPNHHLPLCILFVSLRAPGSWANGERDPATGALTWDTDRFPSGIPALTDWLHEKGMKFGLYTSAGNATCSSGGRPYPIPGSEGHYVEDAQAFADWGVDYVKLDWCGDVKDNFIKDGWYQGHGAQMHRDFATALNATGRPIFFEAVAGFWFLMHETAEYVNSWRFCGDHHDEWENTWEQVGCRFSQGEEPFELTRGEPGAWPFMDLMTIGGDGCAPFEEGVAGMHCPGQTDDNYRSEFAIWSITQSPMLIDSDLRNMTAIMNELLLNAEVIAIHQSTATPPGTRTGHGAADGLCDECQVFSRALEGGGGVAALVNFKTNPKVGASVQDVTASLEVLGLDPAKAYVVRDLYAHEDWPTPATGSVTALGVAPGGVAYLQFSPVA